jgi:hypothetical protein
MGFEGYYDSIRAYKSAKEYSMESNVGPNIKNYVLRLDDGLHHGSFRDLKLSANKQLMRSDKTKIKKHLVTVRKTDLVRLQTRKLVGKQHRKSRAAA